MSIGGIENQRVWNNSISGKAAQSGKTDKNFADNIKEAEKTEKAGRPNTFYAEQAFCQIGKNAPQEVKNAWMEAAAEVGVGGPGMKKNGMLSHISQLMVERVERSMRGQDPEDILGSSVQSARKAVEAALYDLEHPLAGGRRPASAREWIEKERQFYKAFLAKLEVY